MTTFQRTGKGAALAGVLAAAMLLAGGAWLWAQEQEEETPAQPGAAAPPPAQSGEAPKPAPESAPPAATATEPEPAPATPADPLDEFSERLRRIQEQESGGGDVTARGYTYDPGNRRDPFVSPHEIAAPTEGPTSNLPPGIGRMRVQEVELMGFIEHPTWGRRAIVHGSDRMGYWLKEGDRLADGVIVYIDVKNSEVIFRQDVTDPLQIKPYREVKRQLRPAEEERRKK